MGIKHLRPISFRIYSSVHIQIDFDLERSHLDRFQIDQTHCRERPRLYGTGRIRNHTEIITIPPYKYRRNCANFGTVPNSFQSKQEFPA